MDQFILEGIFSRVIFQALWRMLVILFHTSLAKLKQCAGFAFGDHLNFCVLNVFFYAEICIDRQYLCFYFCCFKGRLVSLADSNLILSNILTLSH